MKSLEGARNIIDYITVFAKTQEEHDQRPMKVFQRLRAKNITLNKSSNCEYNMNAVELFGYHINSDGMSADSKNIDASKSAASPQNAGKLRSLLRLAKYVSRFILNYATIVAPLRILTNQKTTWHWVKKNNLHLANRRKTNHGPYGLF